MTSLGGDTPATGVEAVQCARMAATVRSGASTGGQWPTVMKRLERSVRQTLANALGHVGA